MSQSVSFVVKSWYPTSLPEKEITELKGNNYTALYWWLGTGDFEHKNKIRSGNIIANFIKYLVQASQLNPQLITNTMIKIASGHLKEMDLIFKLNNSIYYREIKCNVNLDSEKNPATLNKIDDITSSLISLYPDTHINKGFLCPAWLDSFKNIEGLNDFIQILGYNTLTFLEFDELGKELGEKIRKILL